MTKKGTFLVVLLLTVVALTGCIGGPETITSTFDEGTEGWTVVGDAQSGQVEPTHVAEGGNPGGYLRATDDVAGGVWYWNASDAYLGDISSYSGGTLSFDLNQSATDSQFDAQDVILESGDTRLGHDFGNSSTHPGTDWTSYEVSLSAEAEGWTNRGTEEPATQDEFENVLSELDALWIRGEYRTGSDTGGIDNVELSASG
ncbi:MAG: laminin B domain-containing protein [Halobacteriales archaeon]|nr:laminin B domain-containing protein [Halobacteriales archaeon]